MNQNFIVALIDKSNNIFVKDEENETFKRIYNVLEHDKRIDEFSTECHFYIDEMMYEALGNRGVLFKYTKVFVKDTSKYGRQKGCKFVDIDSFYHHVKNYNDYEENKPLFLMGGSEFLKMSMKISSKMLLTVVDDEINEGFEKFPMDSAKSTFTGRKQIEPELLEEIRKYRRSTLKHMPQNIEIAANGMKIIKTPEKPKYTDDVMNSPDYMFYEFRR